MHFNPPYAVLIAYFTFQQFLTVSPMRWMCWSIAKSTIPTLSIISVCWHCLQYATLFRYKVIQIWLFFPGSVSVHASPSIRQSCKLQSVWDVPVPSKWDQFHKMQNCSQAIEIMNCFFVVKSWKYMSFNWILSAKVYHQEDDFFLPSGYTLRQFLLELFGVVVLLVKSSWWRQLCILPFSFDQSEQWLLICLKFRKNNKLNATSTTIISWQELYIRWKVTNNICINKLYSIYLHNHFDWLYCYKTIDFQL